MPEPLPTPVAFQFTEEMKGYISPGQHTCQQGYDEGKAGGLALMFHLTICIDDLDAFIADPAHHAQAIGYLEGSYIGGRQPVLAGEFNLFADSGDADRKTMLYRLKFENSAGHALTLCGRKDIRDDFGFDTWSDTTTVYVNLYAGHVSAADEGAATLLASGILHIQVRDFLHQLTTFQADAPTLGERLHAVQRFGRLFMGKLWETHGLPRRHGLQVLQLQLDACHVQLHRFGGLRILEPQGALHQLQVLQGHRPGLAGHGGCWSRSTPMRGLEPVLHRPLPLHVAFRAGSTEDVVLALLALLRRLVALLMVAHAVHRAAVALVRGVEQDGDLAGFGHRSQEQGNGGGRTIALARGARHVLSAGSGRTRRWRAGRSRPASSGVCSAGRVRRRGHRPTAPARSTPARRPGSGNPAAWCRRG